MNLSALDDFIAVVQGGSFAAAARATRTPKSTLSKRVQDLEAGLGVRLLERTTRKLRLTPDGALFYERARRLAADAQEIERLMRDRDEVPRGRLRVAVPILFGQTFMGRIAAEYAHRWPETTIDVVFADRRVDLITEDFDCAIRVGALEDSSLVARTFAQSESRVVAATDLVGQRSRPRMPLDIAEWPTIDFAPTGAPRPWILERGSERVELRPKGAVTLGSLYAVRDAARAGAGLAQMPEFIVADDVRTGRLLTVLDDWCGPAADLRIVYPSRRHMSARLRAFIDLMTAAFPRRTLDLAL